MQSNGTALPSAGDMQHSSSLFCHQGVTRMSRVVMSGLDPAKSAAVAAGSLRSAPKPSAANVGTPGRSGRPFGGESLEIRLAVEVGKGAAALPGPAVASSTCQHVGPSSAPKSCFLIQWGIIRL